MGIGDGKCRNVNGQDFYCTSKQQADGSIPSGVQCPVETPAALTGGSGKGTHTGSGQGTQPTKPRKPRKPKKPRKPMKPMKPRKPWKPRKFIKALRIKRIKQRLKFKALTAAKYTGLMKTNYEIAYGIGLGIYNTTAKAFTAGNNVTSSVVKGGAEELFQEEVPSGSGGADVLVEEASGIQVEFKADTDNDVAEVYAGGMDSTSFIQDVHAANAATGGNAPVPKESDITVDTPNHNSGAIVRPTLVASLLVLLVATVYNVQD